MSRVPAQVEGFRLGDRHVFADALAARVQAQEREAAETIARLQVELAQAQAQAGAAVQSARYYAAMVDDLRAELRRLGRW